MPGFEIVLIRLIRTLWIFWTLFTFKVYGQVTQASIWSCLCFKLRRSGWSGMFHIKSGFEFDLLRLIRLGHDFLPDFEIELIRLISEKNFESLFSKVYDQVTQTSMCLCLGLKLDSSGWSGMHLIKSGFELGLFRLIRQVQNSSLPFKLSWSDRSVRKIFGTLFSKVYDQVTQTSMSLCLGLKLDSSGWSGMHLIKSGFELGLFRLIRQVQNSSLPFKLSWSDRSVRKIFGTLFSKVYDQVTQTSMSLCLGLKFDSSGWSGMHLIKSGFEFELLRLIRHVQNFSLAFQIELIRLINHNEQQSITSVLGLNLKCSEWSQTSLYYYRPQGISIEYV